MDSATSISYASIFIITTARSANNTSYTNFLSNPNNYVTAAGAHPSGKYFQVNKLEGGYSDIRIYKL